MPRTDAIGAEGVVIEVMAAGVFRVELANGHRLVAHLPRRSVAAGAQIAPGVKVDLELSPFDLSEGTVVLSEKIKSL